MNDFLKASPPEDARPSHSSSLSRSLGLLRLRTRVTPSQVKLSRAARLEDASHAPQGILVKIKSSSFLNVTSGAEREVAVLEVRRASRPNLVKAAHLASRPGKGFWISGQVSGADSLEGRGEGCSVSAQGAHGTCGC